MNVPLKKATGTLNFSGAKGSRRIRVDTGLSLKQALDDEQVFLPSTCLGRGSCGSCRIRIVSGKLSEANAIEYARLGTHLIFHGWRLSCQTLIQGDFEIQLDGVASHSQWGPIESEELDNWPAAQPTQPTPYCHGIAVDLGTTHIRVSVWDFGNHRRLASRFGLNPQRRFGFDVLSRLNAASADPTTACELSTLVIGAIGDAIADIVRHENLTCLEVWRVAIVGNSAMLTLLTESDASKLLDPDHWLTEVTCEPRDPDSLRKAWGLAQSAEILITPPLAGFVGSDLLADLIAFRAFEFSKPVLLIDVGTNTELALWDGKKAWVTSTPGGPAFEGVGISCGISSGRGAIYRVMEDGEGSTFRYEVYGGGRPLGICGSGLVDWVALLAKRGLLHPSGRFTEPTEDQGFAIGSESDRFYLKKNDVDALQRGKGAIAAAATCLLAGAGLKWTDLSRVFLCGAFGRQLHVSHAQAIGLLPRLPEDRFDLRGPASLIGCEAALQDPHCLDRLNSIRQKTTLINLALLPEFDDYFIANLRLQPIPFY